mmetsp:Transcript_92592/g.138795  ORF Transcript_92592/g.138795 Transcript_92592/m.138795 type:complete len:290 (+) Transcript_92592:1-870(+)
MGLVVLLFVMVPNRKQQAEVDKLFLGDLASQTTDVGSNNQHSASPAASTPASETASAAAARYHNMSFPGMNDTVTHIESCSALIIVELERRFSQNQSMPFSFLIFDNTHSGTCGSCIESVENYPTSCDLPPDIMTDDSPFGYLTIPEWVEQCIIPDHDYNGRPFPNNTGGFMFYYDACPAYLLWDKRSCQEWIPTKAENPNDIHIVQTNLSLVEGDFSGTVVITPSLWGEPDRNDTTIFVPDVFDSCWQVNCSWGEDVSLDQCIQFAQKSLVRVSLADYVDTIKEVMCE